MGLGVVYRLLAVIIVADLNVITAEITVMSSTTTPISDLKLPL